MKIRSLNLGAARTRARAAKTPDGAAMEVRYPGMAAIELTETVPARRKEDRQASDKRDDAFVWLSRSDQQRHHNDERAGTGRRPLWTAWMRMAQGPIRWGASPF